MSRDSTYIIANEIILKDFICIPAHRKQANILTVRNVIPINLGIIGNHNPDAVVIIGEGIFADNTVHHPI